MFLSDDRSRMVPSIESLERSSDRMSNCNRPISGGSLPTSRKDSTCRHYTGPVNRLRNMRLNIYILLDYYIALKSEKLQCDQSTAEDQHGSLEQTL
jgi:hypothetical protein